MSDTPAAAEPDVRILRTGTADARAFIDSLLPRGDFRHIVIKPNWVKHEESPEFPIDALVTSTTVLAQVIEVCLERYPGAEEIVIGDVPLQSCRFDELSRQAGLERLTALQGDRVRPRIRVLDLRRERYRSESGWLELERSEEGDPLGYAEVELDCDSLLEEVSDRAAHFRVSDYDPVETVSQHRRGRHRYLIAKTILAADLVINVAKMKTHQKSGLTAALKNLVGINGSKANLVHHRLGDPSEGGDEFPPTGSRLIRLQVRLRELLQKRSRPLFRLAKLGWEAIKRMSGLSTVGSRENLSGFFYVGAGSWWGNDSIWRMVYDLHRILVFAPRDGGALAATRQRTVVSLVDGIIAGEGNGPLQPLRVEAGVLVGGKRPLQVDLAVSRLMGFDWKKILLLSNYSRFPLAAYGPASPDSFLVEIDGVAAGAGVAAVPVIRNFLPAPGWRNRVELEAP